MTYTQVVDNFTDNLATYHNELATGLDNVDNKLALYTTGGTSTAYTITTTTAPALATGETWRVKFNATAGATPTLNRDSKGAKSLKYYDNAGAKQACDSTTIIANMIMTVVYDGTDYVIAGGLGGSNIPINGWVATSWAGLTRVSATVFTTTTNVSAILQKGYPLKFTDTTVKYGNVLTATWDGSATTITMATNTDYALVGSPSNVYYSIVPEPYGFPAKFSFTQSWVNLTVGNATLYGQFQMYGRRVKGRIGIVLGSTSSVGTEPGFTPPIAPVALGTTYEHFGDCVIRDTGTALFFGAVYLVSSRFYPQVLSASGTYTSPSILTASVPMTWANLDEMEISFDYWS